MNGDNIDMIDLLVTENEEDTDIVETIQIVEVEDVDAPMIETDNAFAALGEPNPALSHAALNNRDIENQHPISAITGLQNELDKINALKTVYSDGIGVANYYGWCDGNLYQEDRLGYFVSLCKEINTVEICTGDSIFGVVVDEAAFIGGQNDDGRDYHHGLIVGSGVVDVRCESDVSVGDYVVSNAYGIAKKATSGCGYKVVALNDIVGETYATIALNISADQIDKFGDMLHDFDSRLDASESNIISAVNVANQAYNLAKEVEASNNDLSCAVGDVSASVGDLSDHMNNMTAQITRVDMVSAQAKAIANNAVTIAESTKSEVNESVNNSMAETSALRKDFEVKVAEIDANLATTSLELQKTNENLADTSEQLQSNIDKVSSDLEGTKTDLNSARDELQTNIDSISGELDKTKEDLQSAHDKLLEDVNGVASDLDNTKEDIVALEKEVEPLVEWTDGERTGAAGFVARANEDSTTLAGIITWQGETNSSMAAFKQEVADTYATIDSVTQLETETSNAITAVKQEASEKYATIESVTSLETETSDAITSVKQEVSEKYATIESVSTLKTETNEAIVGVKQEASDTYATIESVTSLKTETSDAIAGVKQEASEKYATIESVTSLDTKTSEAIAGVKQEVAETYATIESVTSLETDTSKSIATFKQEVQDNYATQTMLTEVNDNLTRFKQEVESDYAKQEMVTAVNNALTSYKQEVTTNYATQQSVTAVNDSLVKFKQEASDTYATQEMVTSVGDNLASFQQKVEDDYATQEMVTTVDNALTAYKQEVEKDYATQQMLSAVEENLASYKQEVTDTYATQQMVTAVGENLASYKQEVGETYATQEMVTKLETDTSKALADYKQEVEDGYATQEMVTNLATDTSKALSDYKQEVTDTYATQTSLTALRTDITNAIAASEEKATDTYASKSDLTSFESDTNVAMARIEQKADANGAYIQSTVSNMDKYSVGPYSQAYGFTLEQAGEVLGKDVFYVPTTSHEEEYKYVDANNATQTYKRAFTPQYLYKWGAINGQYRWITVDKNYTETSETNTSSKAVYFTTIEPAVSGNFGYWYTDGDSITGTTGTYEPYTLYKWELYVDEAGTTQHHWVAVATLNGNSGSRSVSQIRQDTNSIELSVADIKGDVAESKQWIDDNDANIQDVVTWKSDNGDSLVTFMQTAGDNFASASQVVKIVDKDGNIDAASIVTAVNNSGSSVVIDADHIQLDGIVSFVNDEVDAVKENAVYDTKVEYALSSSSTTFTAVAGSDGQWSTTAPAWKDGSYMWQKTTITKGDASVASTQTCIQGAKGEDGYTPVLGKDYFNGTNGEDGTSIVWKGSFSAAPNNPENGWAYYNTSAKASYTYQNGSWYQMSIDGVDGQDGKDGSNGRSIVWKGESSNAPANPQENWVYKDSDDGKVYIYTGSGWELMVLDGSDGQDGANGSDGLSVFITYNDSATAPSTPTGNGTSNGWHTNATSSAIWMSQKVAKDAASGSWGAPIKIQGKDGKDGVSISSTTVSYGTSTSSTTQPTSWQSTMPNVTEGHYLWTRTIIDYTDTTMPDTVTYTYTKQGSKGEAGSPGTSVTVQSIQYQAGTSSTSAPTGTWSNTIVSAAEGQYLWTKTTFSDGEIAYGVAKQGVSGKDGAGVKKVNTHVRSFPIAWWQEHADPECTDTNWTTGSSYDNTHINQGDTVYIIGIATDVIGAGYTRATVALYGVVQDVTNASVKIVPSHLIASGANGEPGYDGVDAPYVTQVTKQYYLSSSNTSLVGGTWSTQPSNFTKGSYMWTRDVYAMSDGSTVYGDPTLDNTFTTISSWCSENDTTLIDGANIATGTVSANQINVADVITFGNIATQDDIPWVPDDDYITTITENTITTTNVVAKNLTVKAANIDGTLSANQIDVEDVIVVGGIATYGDIPSDSHITRITNSTIQTTDVTAKNLKVKAANIEDTLSASQINVGEIITFGNLATQNDIPWVPDDDYITTITESTITTKYVEALEINVKDAQIESLGADKLTAGTIDADVITVTNLNADNITSGTVKAEFIDVDNLKVDAANVSGVLSMGSDGYISTAGVDEGDGFYYYMNLPGIRVSNFGTFLTDGLVVPDATIGGMGMRDDSITGDSWYVGNDKFECGSFVAESDGAVTAESVSSTDLSGLNCSLENISSDSISANSITVNDSISTPSISVAYMNLGFTDDYGESYHYIAYGSTSVDLYSDSGYLVGTWYADSCLADSSDINKKNSIQDPSDKYDVVFKNLSPKTFKYNNGTSDRKHFGFIAQEVEQAVIESGLTTQDFAGFIRATEFNEETEEFEDVCYLRYGEFVALNTWQIQKLQTRVTELENQIIELQNLINGGDE